MERTKANVAALVEQGRPAEEVDRLSGLTEQERTNLWHAQAQQAAHLPHASCYWVTEAMTYVALDASADLPDWTPLQAMPEQSGLLVWEAGLPPVPWPGARQEAWQRNALGQHVPPLVTPHAVTWRLRQPDGMLELNVLTRTDLMPAEALSRSWAESPLVLIIAAVIVPDQHAQVATETLWLPGLLHAVGATWLLMQQPTVADSRRVDADHSDRKKLRRQNLPSDVHLVDLRRVTARDPAADGESGRHLTHRHLVRGHWRQQACGPQRSQRRPTWVPPYVKGPDGAPLIVRERVMVWRR